jgi:pyruvate/2-oxoglutarate/acetoin dehydrogenase E1 component
MFGDFLTLAADQLINHAAKFGWMYSGNKPPEEQPTVPMVIRTPMGGRRGYGPTHSQTLEKHFLGVPGLHVLAPCAVGDPGGLLQAAILNTRDPLLFVENKLLYLRPVLPLLGGAEIEIDIYQDGSAAGAVAAPTYTLRVRGAPSAVLTLAAYGYMADLAREAVLRLAYEYEVFAELIVPTRLAPFRIDAILASARRTGRMVTVEEGALDLGWGAEAVARVSQALGGGLSAARRVAAANLPIPAGGSLEAAVLPGIDDIIQSCLECVQIR